MGTPIENNTEDMVEILEMIDNLPNAGSGGSEPDLVIRTPSRYPDDYWTVAKFSVVSGSIATVFEKGLQEQMPVVRLMYSDEYEGDELREYNVVTHITTDDMGTTFSRVVIDFTARTNDRSRVWECTLISTGMANINGNVFTEFTHTDKRDILSGYATEEFVVSKIAEAELGGDDTESKCTPQLFGAVGDGTTDDSAAFNDWFEYLADNNVVGYIPNGTYLVKSGIGYAPTTPSGKRISFVGESADRVIIKAGFTVGTVLDFWNCYIGEIGNLTIDNNESTPNENGVTGFRMVDMQYTEDVFSYIHDINIINVGRRAGIIHHSAGAGSTAIKYVNMERVNAVGFTSDRALWGEETTEHKNPCPVGIIVADVSHFHFINCTTRNVKSYPMEFKNFTEYCSNENCVIENCGQGIYLGQEWAVNGGDPDTIGHRYYKAIGNVIKDVPIGVMASNLAHCTFDNNTIYAYNDGSGSVCGFAFNAPCEFVTGAGNSYYGDRYAVQFRKGNAVNGTCNDNVIETAIYKTEFRIPYSFTQIGVPDYSYRCTVIVTNCQQIANTRVVDANDNAYIPITDKGRYPDWSHLKWYVMGDSLTAQDNTYTEKRYYDFVQEKTGIQVIVDGIGGTGYGAGASSGQSFLDRVKNVPADVDVLTIFGSGNDIRYAESASQQIYDTLSWLLFNRPGLRVIVVPPSPWNGYNKREDPWKAYCDRLQVCALACDFRYLSDLYDCPPFNANYAEHREKFFTKCSEGIHPNEDGHRALAPYFYNALLQELALKV